MSRVEEMLNNKKKELDNIEVPEELEHRLRRSLHNAKPKKSKKHNLALKVAAWIIAISLIGYNIDTLAFYGKKLMGFDHVMTDTLKELNELGKGQIIDKSYTFKSGVKITVDGAMMDENQLYLFYTIGDKRGKIDELNIDINPYLEGFISHYNAGSGEGQGNESLTEIKWKTEYEAPHFYEKTLKFSFTLNVGDKAETGEISFELDRSKAMGSTFKKKLNKSIKIDQGEITFDSIVASPTTTYINGKVQDILSTALDEVSGEGFRATGIDIKLIANGVEVEKLSGGISTNIKGITFDNKFDALPKDLKSLQIVLVSMRTNNKIDEAVKLVKGEQNKKIQILGKEIEVKKVYETDGNTYVTITSEEDVILSKVYLVMSGKAVELKNTIRDRHDKNGDGVITFTRTLCFEGRGEDLTLKIQGLMYSKIYNSILQIDIE